MADSDGATHISDLTRIEQAVKRIEKGGLGLGIGSRAHLVDEAVAKVGFPLPFFFFFCQIGSVMVL